MILNLHVFDDSDQSFARLSNLIQAARTLCAANGCDYVEDCTASHVRVTRIDHGEDCDGGQGVCDWFLTYLNLERSDGQVLSGAKSLRLLDEVSRQHPEAAITVWTETIFGSAQNVLLGRLLAAPYAVELLDKLKLDDELVVDLAHGIKKCCGRVYGIPDPGIADAAGEAFKYRRDAQTDEDKRRWATKLESWERCLGLLLRDLACQVEPEYSRLGGGRSGAGVITLEFGAQRSYAVKLADWLSVSKELENYTKVVAPFIDSAARTDPTRAYRSGECGILAYDLTSSTGVPRTLAQIATNPAALDPGDISAAVRAALTTDRARWTEDGSGPSKTRDAAKLYRQHFLKDEGDEAVALLRDYLRQVDCGEMQLASVEKALGRVESRTACPLKLRPNAHCHGDLNAYNLVWKSAYKRFIMVDFHDCTKAPLMVDFAKLEASLKYDVRHQKSVEELVELESFLMKDPFPADMEKRLRAAEGLSSESQLHLRLVLTVRQAAVHHLVNQDRPDEYLVALFFATLKHARYLLKDIRGAVRWLESDDPRRRDEAEGSIPKTRSTLARAIHSIGVLGDNITWHIEEGLPGSSY